MKIKRNMTPPQRDGWGWTFKDGPVMITGHTFDDLVQNVGAWRIKNRRPMGDPEKEIEAQICELWPHFCTPEKGEKMPPPADKGVTAGPTLIQRVSKWLSILGKSLPFVNQDEAERRAAICASCKKNELWETGCATCIQAARAELLKVRGGRSTTHDDKLQACIVSGIDNKTQVHIALSALNVTESQKKHLPANCWKK